MKGMDPRRIFNINSDSEFEEMAILTFRHQFEHSKVYRQWCDLRKIQVEEVKSIKDIPFLPVEFFKSREIRDNSDASNSIVFSSSATTSQQVSRHFVHDPTLYKESFTKGFERFYGHVANLCILALLPGYLERKDSSLVYMFEHLIQGSAHPLSGFFLKEEGELIKRIEELKTKKQKTLLIGVSYALLDLCEKVKLNDNFMVMETGGMKGKRKELTKAELHETLKKGLDVTEIHSEYGMTEMLSQAYSKKDGLFQSPPWLKFSIRDVNDPLSFLPNGKTGGINIIDLANFHSCSFLAIKDLGCINEKGLELMGRYDDSDIRGCNLMIQPD